MDRSLDRVPLNTERRLTASAFQRLTDVPLEVEWFDNLGSAATRRCYEEALHDFMRFAVIAQPDDVRAVTRAHVIAWRDGSLMRRRVTR